MNGLEMAGKKELPREAVFALDIGTRSIIGMVGIKVDGRMKVIAIERAEHSKRAMIDGQIEDIAEVARLSAQVRSALEEKTGYRLEWVCVAAAGRALKTEEASFETEFQEIQRIDEENISRLEAGAVGEAQQLFLERDNDTGKQFYLTGYTVSGYFLDGYPISSLLDHKGKKIRADIVATFLPGEVVESLYTAMHRAGLEVAGLTLEPIAAMNAAIPESLRLLNLVMVDIGAGTSDIAVCRDGKVVGYTMATLAGDEITESIMKNYLVDFETAERIKMQLGEAEEIAFSDILGNDRNMPAEQILDSLQDAVARLAQEIADRILEVNMGAPSAIFLAGGGSRMRGLTGRITEALGVDGSRASVAGRYFSRQTFSENCELEDPEYATPLGILISAGLNLINDSFSVLLNGKQAKLFSNGTLHVSDILMMNGYTYSDLIGRAGKSIVITVDGVRRVFYGTPGEPAVLRLNGEESRISDLVHAGDEITFVPAHNGTDAQARTADIFGTRSSFDTVDGILVNGEISDLERRLCYGDVVETLQYMKKKEQKEAQDVSETPDHTPYEPDDEEHDTYQKTEAEESNQVWVKAEEEGFHGTKETAASAPQREEKELAGGVGPAEAFGSWHLKLNDKPLILPEKKDGAPYYLMDLIQYSGVDLEHVTAPVILKVNGRNAPFQQEIKENDTVEIYEEKQIKQS